MSDRPKWMPEELQVADAMNEYDDSIKLLRQTGLRAQIAVLEDLCHHAIPMKHLNTYPVEAAPKALLLDMIAALRKELGE